jgi:hypothetical protein
VEDPTLDAHWSELSDGHFVALSATSAYEPDIGNNVPDNYITVVFGIIAGSGNVWEHSVQFKDVAYDTSKDAYSGGEYKSEAATDENWRLISTGSFQAISATYDLSGATPSKVPVVSGILTTDHSLWEHDVNFSGKAQPTAQDEAATNQNWAELSNGVFV